MNVAMSRRVDQTGSQRKKKNETLELFINADLEDPDDAGGHSAYALCSEL